jgi:hypothetical protein
MKQRSKPKYSLEDGKAVMEILNPRFHLNDEYGETVGSPIIQNGMDTGYDMCYKHVDCSFYGHKVWVPVGAVSRDWTPIGTHFIIESIKDRLEQTELLKSISVKKADPEAKGTMHRIDIVIDKPCEILKKPRDAGTGFVNL